MSEHTEQVEVFKWAKLMRRVHPELECLYAIPNAGKRSWRAGKYMAAEGLRSGVPDMCLPIRRGKYGSLYIEMKDGDEKIKEATDNQLSWLERLNRHGNLAVICTSSQAAILQILSYLESK